jgi:glycine hydroxymethyltransferase
MAAKAVALTEASRPAFADYARQIVDNAATLADELQRQGAKVLTGGTDNHLLLIDVRAYGLTGRQAETALREAAVTVNRNVIPFDPNGSWYTSGLRLGTPATTTLGMGPEGMREVAAIVHTVLAATEADSTSKARYTLPAQVRDQARSRVGELLARHPLYPGIDL